MQGRRGKVFAPGTIDTRTYDDVAMARIVVAMEPGPRYGDGQHPALAFNVGVAGADPNAVPPPDGSFLPATNFGMVAMHSRHGAGQSLDVEIWTRSDSDGVPSPWLLVATVTGLVAYREYLVATRFRDVYLRPINVVLGAGPAFAFRACSV